MQRIVLIVVNLLAGCSDGLLSGLNGDGQAPSVCVRGGAGRCCAGFSETCTISDQGCKPGEKLPRTRTRCLLCWPHDIDDGGPHEFGEPPPNPAPDSGVYTDADGGVHDPRIWVCGPATYFDP